MARIAVLVVGALVLAGCVIGETGEPEIIANSSVTLTGTVHWPDDAGVFSDFWFEYGTTDAYGQSSQREAVQEYSPGETPVSTRISGLLPETTYHYRLCTSDHKDGYGTCGIDQTVTTSGDRDFVSGKGVQPMQFGAYTAVEVVASGGPGYLDGTGSLGGAIFVPPGHLVSWGGPADVSCIRVEGNNAVVGLITYDPIGGEISQLLYIQDNGASGDRWGLTSWTPPGCPAPDPSLATIAASDFVVEDG